MQTEESSNMLHGLTTRSMGFLFHQGVWQMDPLSSVEEPAHIYASQN